MLADAFIRGALENGNEITEYDVMRKDIRPCLGCNHCGMSGNCVQKDDYEKELKGLIRETDVIAFAMPVYYYNWPAQLKSVIDRFYSFTIELGELQKKTVLIAAAWDDTDSVFRITEAYYQALCDYMHFEDLGTVFGKGCGTPIMTESSPYMQEAYRLGKQV